jgi:hypothetical protein
MSLRATLALNGTPAKTSEVDDRAAKLTGMSASSPAPAVLGRNGPSGRLRECPSVSGYEI